jgi:hypothetical protein
MILRARDETKAAFESSQANMNRFAMNAVRIGTGIRLATAAFRGIAEGMREGYGAADAIDKVFESLPPAAAGRPRARILAQRHARGRRMALTWAPTSILRRLDRVGAQSARSRCPWPMGPSQPPALRRYGRPRLARIGPAEFQANRRTGEQLSRPGYMRHAQWLLGVRLLV